MAFTAKDVQQLRERTSCGMMDCKKALTESGGDMDKAIELLREKGLAKQAKKADRVAAEGVVYACVENGIGVVIEVNSETDFVAKNEQAEGMEGTVEEALRDKVLTIGENIKIRRFVYTEDPAVTYVHGGGRIGVMVTFETDCAGKEGFEACGKDVAMQVAAINPLYVDEAAVPADVVEKEKEIIRVQISTDEKTKNKPAQVVEKMVSGKIGKYFKENCLVEQPFVKNGDQTVGQYVAETAKALGGSIKVKGFTRFEKGEGLEKREDNFAEEVAGMMK